MHLWWTIWLDAPVLGVIPILVGPLQVLLALFPAIAISLGSAFLALFRPATFAIGVRLLWRMKFSLLLLALLVGGCVWTARAIFSSAPAPPPATLSSVDWPIFRGGLQRQGVVAGSGVPLRGAALWSYNSDWLSFLSSPAVVGDRIYISGSDLSLNRRGVIVCLDADTGKPLWRVSPGGMRPVFSSPVVSGKYLVCGEGFHQTTDARVFCLDVTQNGRVLWSYRTGNHVEATPCIDRGRVYVGAGDDGYYCFELEPDARGQARVVWHAPGWRFQDAETSVAVTDGKVFAGLGVGGNAVVCLDANNGNELWRVPTPYPVFTPPTVIAGKVIVGTGNGDYTFDGRVWAARELRRLQRQNRTVLNVEEVQRRFGPTGEVWCIDIATHQVEWRFPVQDTIMGSLPADENGLCFGSRDEHLYFLSLDGRELGRYHARAPILSCPTLTTQYVHLVTEDGRLIALDRQAHAPVWEVRLGAKGQFIGSPVLARGHAYVGTPASGFMAVGWPAEPVDDALWSGELGSANRCAHIDGSVLPEAGMIYWKQILPTNARQGASVTGPLAATRGRLLAPMQQAARPGLICFDIGAAPNRSPTPAWFYRTPNAIVLSPAANRDQVWVVDGQPGHPGRQLHCLEAAEGRLQWRQPVAPAASGTFALGRDALFIQDTASGLTRFDLRGQLRWRQNIGALLHSPLVREGLVLTTSSSARLSALDAATGAVLWSVAARARSAPTVEGGLVYVGTDSGLTAHRLINGEVVWSRSFGPISRPISARRDRVACVTERGDLVVLDSNGVTLSLRRLGVGSSVQPLLLGDHILFASGGTFLLHRTTSQRAEPWLLAAPDDAPGSAPILANGMIWFSTARGGLAAAGKPR